MDIRFLARSRHPVVCSGEEKTWAATATRQNLCGSRAMADLQGRCSYLEVEAESRLSYWYDISKMVPNLSHFQEAAAQET